VNLENTFCFVLLTHRKSKYLDELSNHGLFQSMIQEFKNNDFQVENQDFFLDLELNRWQVILQFNDAISIFLIQLTFYLKVLKRANLNCLLKNIRIILGLFVTLAIDSGVVLSALFSSNRKNILITRVMRQSNIAHNHIAALKSGLKSCKPFVLIVEDDIKFQDLHRVREGLKFTCHLFNIFKDLSIINVSESFSTHELGLNCFVKKIQSSKNFMNFVAMKLNYPATNTVCASIYKSDLIPHLISELEKLKSPSFVPIDIKVNLALHNLVEKSIISRSAYATIIPGIFKQDSLFHE